MSKEQESNVNMEDVVMEACQFMASEVHAPAFFSKLAAHGIVPSNDEEASELLMLGAKLQEAELQDIELGVSSNIVKQANVLRDDVIEESKIDKIAVDFAKQQPLAKTAALIYANVTAGLLQASAGTAKQQ